MVGWPRVLGRGGRGWRLEGRGKMVLRCCSALVKKPEFGKKVYSFLTPKSIHGNSGPTHEALHSFLTIKDSRYM